MKLVLRRRKPEPQQPESVFLDELADQLKERSSAALDGQDERLRQVAAEFSYLGSIADEVLGTVLHDLHEMPGYFSQVARLGLEKWVASQQPPDAPEVVQGKASRVIVSDEIRQEDEHER